MKQRFYLLFALLIAITGCNNYRSVIEFDDGSIKEEAFRESSDTSAYKYAYQSFCISKKVFSEVASRVGSAYSKEPTDLIVYHKSGRIITSEGVADASLRRIYDSCMGTLTSQTKVDSTKINELLPFFNVKADEFDPKAPVWYEPKSAPKYTNRNGIYCYFQTQDNRPRNFRFRVQYYADDWLFFKKIQFSIDGNAYEYVPRDTETDCGNGGKIWEWCDDAITVSSDKELIKALANAKAAKMKFIGTKYYDIKELTPQQILDIKRALELYEAMGGRL